MSVISIGDKVTGTAKVTVDSMLWVVPAFVIKGNAKLHLEVSKTEDYLFLICVHDSWPERLVKEHSLGPQVLKSPRHDHSPFLVFISHHLLARSCSTAQSAFLPLPEHTKHAAASGPLHMLVTLLGLLYRQLHTWLSPSLLLSLCSVT